ncbi:GNAT family N-acetyltransferase [Methylobacillus methanolivorans]|uniref:GNAT family N-acetyltransferase n=1 Tax=Methylobacillus methanolivorans TaxID=1848927 RepID=A0ABW8GL68_9PROT
MKLPDLPTARLLLRPYVIQNAPTVEAMLDAQRATSISTGVIRTDPAVAQEASVDAQGQPHNQLTGIIYAVIRYEDAELIGNVSLLDIHTADQRAEIGYWVGSAYWNNGYCTEALQALLNFAHATLGITRITARCLTSNLASIRVLEKCGLARESLLRAHNQSGGKYEDVLMFGLCWPERS